MSALLATWFLSKQEISPRMKNITDPRHRKLHPMRGEPLPLTKNIFPPPNFRLEVEKKLGGIMNSRNSDNKEATRLRVC